MRLFVSFSLIILSLTVFANKEITRFWHVTGASSLQINGTTNVNTFQCGSAYESGSDMIRELWDPYSEKWEIHGSVFIEVETFDCRNRIMNNDFRNTLKHDKYPEIQIEFLNLKEVQLHENTRKAQGYVKITLAGKSHKYFISSELEFLDDQYSILRGEQVFRFSDFGLEPPQKGFGLVKVNDEIEVSFDLILEQTSLTEN
ncbi:MAG: YceI family protein [Bacteroidetes bacterium]|nr:MAG: YceI family protein [Bacteroidota bacterium]